VGAALRLNLRVTLISLGFPQHEKRALCISLEAWNSFAEASEASIYESSALPVSMPLVRERVCEKLATGRLTTEQYGFLTIPRDRKFAEKPHKTTCQPPQLWLYSRSDIGTGLGPNAWKKKV
jgi:hypothetical protein